MHSITSEKHNAREIFSIVTSSLVNLPLAYRTGSISKDGLVTVRSGYVQDVVTSNGVNLKEEGKAALDDIVNFVIDGIDRTPVPDDSITLQLSK